MGYWKITLKIVKTLLCFKRSTTNSLVFVEWGHTQYFHYLFNCKFLNTVRTQKWYYLEKFYFTEPTVLKFPALLICHQIVLLKKPVKFIRIISQIVKTITIFKWSIMFLITHRFQPKAMHLTITASIQFTNLKTSYENHPHI